MNYLLWLALVGGLAAGLSFISILVGGMFTLWGIIWVLCVRAVEKYRVDRVHKIGSPGHSPEVG